MKIILIEPRGTSQILHNGLAYLCGNLIDKTSHQVKVFDLNFLDWTLSMLKQKVVSEEPDLIGISIKSSNLDKSLDIISFLKKEVKAKFVYGGPHITLCGQKFMEKNNLFDFALQGEAEYSFNQFCQALAGKFSYEKIPGLIYRKADESLIINQPRIIDNLDNLSFPDYSDFEEVNLSQLSYPLLTSRGCPYSCIYCSVNRISGRHWRYCSPESVIKELQQAKQKHNIKSFVILDDNFTLNKQRAINFCNFLIKENINLSWSCPNGLRADSLDEELVSKIKEAGCDNVAIGIESGDKKVFDFIQKGESLKDIKKAISLLNAYQIRTTGFLIVGLPYDSIRATKNTLRFIDSLNIYGGVKWSMLVPYPKTFIWDWVDKNGKFLMDFTKSQHFIRDGTVVEPVFETEDFSAKQRKKAFILANISTGLYHVVIKKTKIKTFYKLKIIFYLLRYNSRLLFKKIINRLL